MIKYIFIMFFITSCASAYEPRVRPDNWAEPVIGTRLDNFYFVDKGIYRSEQPEHENVNTLQ